MRISAKPIKNYLNNNSWEYVSEVNIRGGETSTFYFQLIDLDKNNMRYISSFAPNLLNISVMFNSVDSSKVVTIPATLCTIDDKSIWTITLNSNIVPSSGNLFFNFVENGISKKFYLLDVLKVETLNVGGC